jgi:NAD(P)-dependent dehydrogenase (short-subunit alcohol dehydrogenase family)
MGIELTNRIAIVTGAAQGTGEATVRKLAERGATVVGFDIQAELLKQVTDSVPNAVARVVDVTNPEAIQSAIQDIHQQFGRIDILVNVAGGSSGGKGIEAITIEQWHKGMNLNLHACFYMIKAIAPIMRSQKYGRIVTVGSGAGRSTGRARILAYTAAKAGVHGLMRQVAEDLAADGVLCNSVAPGFVLSPTNLKKWEARTEEQKREMLATIPMRRVSEPYEIANLIAFLVSDENSYITGQTIGIDGGALMV